MANFSSIFWLIITSPDTPLLPPWFWAIFGEVCLACFGAGSKVGTGEKVCGGDARLIGLFSLLKSTKSLKEKVYIIKGKMAFWLWTCPSQGLRCRRRVASSACLDQSRLPPARLQWQLEQMLPPRWWLAYQSPEIIMKKVQRSTARNCQRVWPLAPCDYCWKLKVFPPLILPKSQICFCIGYKHTYVTVSNFVHFNCCKVIVCK